MLPTFVIGLREGLEAALIVGIIAAFLGQQGRRDALRQVWIGTAAAVAICIGIAIALQVISSDLPQQEQEGLETVVGALAVVMVTYMIIFMRRHARGLKGNLEGAAASALASGSSRALVAMAFLAVLREGFETAVFLLATFHASGDATTSWLGAVLGILLAAAIGYSIYRGGVRLNLARFFKITGMVLVLVAAGLVMTAFRTANEAGWLTAGQGQALDLSGLVLLTPAVLAFVLPLVLGQPEHWPLWGWILMAASVPLVGTFVLAERRVAATGGTPLIPGRVLRVPGVPVAIAALFTVMIIFSGFFFTLALHLQDGLGYTPLRAGLTFAPTAAAFALVSLNWRRLSARWHGALIVGGFVTFAATIAGLAWVLHSGGTGGAAIYLIGAITGAGMAAAFSPLMTRVLMSVPVELAADATGVVVTVNQLGLLVGVATFGTLYLNLAGRLPSHAFGAFRHVSAHAEAITFLALAALAILGAALAVTHVINRHHAPA